jgi:hypothetical protein
MMIIGGPCFFPNIIQVCLGPFAMIYGGYHVDRIRQ